MNDEETRIAELRKRLDLMDKLDAADRAGGADLPEYRPMQALEDTLRGVGEGVTFGHLPQVQGFLDSAQFYGPDYEKAKSTARDKLAAAYRRNAPLVVGGSLAGSMALPGGAFPKIVGPAKTALLSAITSAMQNPGGDVDSIENLKGRGKNALYGALLGAILGKTQTASGPIAEELAYSALGPTKADNALARRKNEIWAGPGSIAEKLAAEERAVQDANLPPTEATTSGPGIGTKRAIGRSVLDAGVLNRDGILPPSKETIYLRSGVAASKAGKAKQDVIDILDDEAKELGYIDTRKVENDVRNATGINEMHPAAAAREARAAAFAEQIARNSANQPFITLKEADRLKVDSGKLINWKKPRADFTDEELLNAALYDSLNRRIDDKASFITDRSVLANPNLSGKLSAAKKNYGNLDTAKRIAGASMDKPNKFPGFGLTEYGLGAAGLGYSLYNEDDRYTALGTGLAAALLGKIARSYGTQFAAKQADNISRLLNNRRAFNVGAFGALPDMLGEYDRNTWSQLRTTRE